MRDKLQRQIEAEVGEGGGLADAKATFIGLANGVQQPDGLYFAPK